MATARNSAAHETQDSPTLQPSIGKAMAQHSTPWRRPRFWIWLVAIVILLIFLYFFKPFEGYLLAAVPNIRFDNVIFWFASLVGVVAFAFAPAP